MWVKASITSLLGVAILHSTIIIADPSQGSCPDGSYPVNCLINPCQYPTCSAVEGATCVADYSGGCNARWLLNGQEVTRQCKDAAALAKLPVDTKRCSIPGQVYRVCGSACPPTCDNPHPICTKQCVRGCQCPIGTCLVWREMYLTWEMSLLSGVTMMER